MSRGENEADLVLVCNLATESEAAADLKFRIAIVIVGQRRESHLVGEVGVKKVRILESEVRLVTALRILERRS